MAEDAGEKTEAPTPKRRQQAMERGNIARSPDLVAAALVVGAMLLLSSFGMPLVQALQALLTEMLSSRSMSDFSGSDALRGLLTALLVAGRALMPLMIGVFLIATLGNVL